MKEAGGLLVVSNARVARPRTVGLRALIDTSVPIDSVGHSMTSYRRWRSRSARVSRRSSGSPSISTSSCSSRPVATRRPLAGSSSVP